MGRALDASFKSGETTIRTAERLLDAGEPLVELPRYVEELAAAARKGRVAGVPSPFEKAVAKWRGQIDRLGQGAAKEAGEHTLRSATQQLVKDLGKAKPEAIDKIVDRWVLEKARYQARVVARTEAVQALRDSQVASAAEQPWCHGIRWSLSPGHPRPDICDAYAGQDLYGLGAGGYPADKVPHSHPGCGCSVSPVADADHFKRELAKAKGEPEPPRPWESGIRETGDQWLRKQPREAQEAILGPTRAKALRGGVSVMQGERLVPVHQLTGDPKPTRTRGTRVAAGRVVRADRATMVRPFPELRQRSAAKKS